MKHCEGGEGGKGDVSDREEFLKERNKISG